MEAKDIIERIHRQWLIAKEQRRQRCEASHMSVVAEKLAACNLFKETEDIAGIARLFTSPQGVEFCLAANFPLKNPKTAVLIGKTTATIKCDTCENHTVITMHGASATVLASGWAVVRTEAGVSTNIIRRTSDNAIIL